MSDKCFVLTGTNLEKTVCCKVFLIIPLEKYEIMQNSVKYVQNKHMASEGCSCDDQEKELLSSSQGWCQVSAEACRGCMLALSTGSQMPLMVRCTQS